mgnify:CR=1 FL=1|tara:strand:+ start:275 stop:469 length:195 start_codon:yes stop_codon:yes gene_type:complete
MANKINEVWYCYNAKGKKTAPYKSNYIKRTWIMFKENWGMIILTVMFGSGLFIALMYAMLMLLS